jgi:hypothetical protein
MTEPHDIPYLTKKWAVIATLLSSPLYFLFDHLGDPARARAAACGRIVIIAAIRSRWDLRKRVWFWATATLLVLAHIPLILFTPWTNESLPSFGILPFAMFDWGIMYACILLVEKGMNRLTIR